MRKSLLVLGLSACTIAMPTSQLYASDTSTYVYVESNLKGANANSIYAFAQQANGQLKPIAGSPFATGGAGVQYSGYSIGPFDSDQEVITNPQHTLLFAVNAGSDTIAVMHIGENGKLTPVEGSPFPSGGSDPVSLALDGNILFIANQSGDFARPATALPNYTTMRVQQDGTLVPVFGQGNDTINDTARTFQQTVSVAAGSSPSQVLLVPNKNIMFTDDFLGGLLGSFRYDDQGGMHELPAIALPASEFNNDNTTPRLPLGMWVNPGAPVLYVGYVTANKVGVYRYGQGGALEFLRTVPNAGKGICWIRSNRSGSRIYTTDTATNQISVYDSSDPEYPVEIQTLTLQGPGQAFQLSLSQDGRSLFAISQRSAASLPVGEGNALHTLKVKTDGTLVEEASPFVLPGADLARPQGIAVVQP